MATSRDVAELAKVSLSTVSRAFSETSSINEETRKKVLDAAKELEYTPNLLARSLKRQKSEVIGLIVSDIDNPFFSNVTQIIEAELKREGYRLLLSYSNENPDQELDNLMLLSSSRVDGIIFTPTSNKHTSTIKQLIKQNTALVQLYRFGYEDLNSVLIDDQKGAYMATKHLIQNGHSNILLLTVNPTLSIYKKYEDPRSKGYKQALKEENIPFNESNIMYVPYQTNLNNMISQKIDQIQPTGIIAGTNTIGIDVLKVCKERKILIPNDISFIMFDDVNWAPLHDLTVVSQPTKEVALATCRFILEQIGHKNFNKSPMKTTIEPILIARNSVKNLYANKMNSIN